VETGLLSGSRRGLAIVRASAPGTPPHLLGREIEQQQITLRVDVTPEPLPIHADRIQLDVQDELRRRQATLPIIVLTGHANVPTSVRALNAGAIDFLQKPGPPKVLLERIHAAIEVDRQARAATAGRAGVLARLANLTPREREVMELLIAGKTSKAIAAALRVSVRIVEGYRRMVLSAREANPRA